MEQISFISSDKVLRAELYFLNNDCDSKQVLKMFKPNQVVQFNRAEETAE